MRSAIPRPQALAAAALQHPLSHAPAGAATELLRQLQPVASTSR